MRSWLDSLASYLTVVVYIFLTTVSISHILSGLWPFGELLQYCRSAVRPFCTIHLQSYWWVTWLLARRGHASHVAHDHTEFTGRTAIGAAAAARRGRPAICCLCPLTGRLDYWPAGRRLAGCPGCWLIDLNGCWLLTILARVDSDVKKSSCINTVKGTVLSRMHHSLSNHLARIQVNFSKMTWK